MDSKSKGNLGENMARDYLKSKGIEIIEENFRYKKAEIDLIGILENEILVFAEVKMRKGNAHGYPEEFVTRGQVRQIKKAAEHYIFAINWHKDVRFDVVAIEELTNTLTHFEDAFY
jgi:putative endonuclease